MNEGDTLLADIIANPGDDGLRLIFADWCQDNGEEARAEFVRCEIEYAKLTCHHPDAEPAHDPRYADGGRSYCNDSLCRHCSFYGRAYDLKHGSEFVDVDSEKSRAFFGLPFAWQTDVTEWRSWRGFIHTVRCPLQVWLDHGKEIVRLHPVERVEVTGREPAASIAHFGHPYYWGEGECWAGTQRWFLPRSILQLLIGFEARGQRSQDYPSQQRFYPTREAALDALSAALLLWARAPAHGARLIRPV